MSQEIYLEAMTEEEGSEYELPEEQDSYKGGTRR